MSTAKSPRNVVSVRFSDKELEQVKATSDLTGEPVSTIIRNAALQKRHVLTGVSGNTNQAFGFGVLTLSGSGIETTAVMSGGVTSTLNA